ncbi:MAG: ABC transporter permease [bacterium]
MKYLEVAKWEFLEKVKSKAFLISLVMMPLIMIVFGVLPGLLATRGDEKTLTIGILDESDSLFSELSQRIGEKYKLDDGSPNYRLRNLRTDSDFNGAKTAANTLVSSDSIEGYFHIPKAVFDSGKVEYRARNVGNFRTTERFSRTIEEIIVEKRLKNRGLNPIEIRKLMTDVTIKSIKVSEKGVEKESGFIEVFYSSYIFIMMLMFLVLTSGQLLIRSVIEEKQNRVIEVLLSSCSAQDLMIGKILGLSGLGLLQISLWGIIGLGFALKAGSSLIAFDILFLAAIYFVLGYILYSAIFVAAGSPITTEQEAQQITTYISLALVFPIVLAFPAMQNPDSLWIKIISFIPIMTPAFMLLRLPIQMPPLWEIFGTIAVLGVSSVVMMWIAGKIFRTAILVYGKRPSLPELVRWLREK